LLAQQSCATVAGFVGQRFPDGGGEGAVSQAEDRRAETAARIAELQNIKTSLEEALDHAQRAYPPRGSRRIELLIHAALRETNIQIENLRSLP
jgi:hypothetical protein